MKPQKTILFLLVLIPHSLLLGQSSRHQWGVQFRAGISGMVYRDKYEDSEKFIQSGAAIRFSSGIGGLYLYRVNPQLFLQSGLGYELSGYRVKEFEVYQHTPNMPEGVYIGKAHGRINYHHLMLSFSGKAKPLGAETMVYVRGGFAGQINLKHSALTVLEYQNGTVVSDTEALDNNNRIITPFNARLEFGLGLEFKAFGHTGFYVEPTYGFSILPIYRQYEGSYWQYVTGLNLGFLW